MAAKKSMRWAGRQGEEEERVRKRWRKRWRWGGRRRRGRRKGPADVNNNGADI